MRNRDYKVNTPGGYFHVYNRGNAKANIFLDQSDYHLFLHRLRQNIFPDPTSKNRIVLLPPNSFTLIAYCLMPNHYHLLLRQDKDAPIGKLIGKICTSYSIYFNKKYDRVGHIFQDKFKQVPILHDKQLIWLAGYIHLNPVKARLCNTASKYQHSSIREYIINNKDLVDPSIILDQISEKNYLENLSEQEKASREQINDNIAIDE